MTREYDYKLPAVGAECSRQHCSWFDKFNWTDVVIVNAAILHMHDELEGAETYHISTI